MVNVSVNVKVMFRMTKRFLLAACLIGASAATSAACFDPNALHRYPPAGSEVYFDLHVAAEKDKIQMKALAERFGDPGGAWFGYKPVVARYIPSKPPFIALNQIDPRKYDAKSFIERSAKELEGISSKQHFVTFYEPDGKGGRRACRAEEWAPRHENGPKKPGDEDYKAPWGEPTLSNFPALKALTAEHTPRIVHLYHYDKAGRLAEWGMHDVDTDWKPGQSNYVSRDARLEECYLYDSAGRLSQYVMQRRILGMACSDTRRENSSRMLYRYDASGRYLGTVQQSGTGNSERAPGTESAKWWETYRLRPQPDVYHEAEADSLWGLRFVTGLPQIENVSDRKVPDDQLRAIYRFPQPTPTSVMDGLPMSVKAYRRVRIGPATSMGTASEMYPANGGITERILSRDMGGNVFRHERFNKDGKVYQVINDGLLEDGKPSTLYQEDLVTLDKVLAHPKINVPRTHVRLRVYEVNAAGQHTLTAISWARALVPGAYRTPGRGGAVIDMYKDAKKAWANRDKPAAKPPAEDDLRVRYTDLQGKEIWADWDVFLKATGFIEFEQAFYPHGHPMNKKPPVDYKGPPIQ
jgi:hypothetical protein